MPRHILAARAVHRRSPQWGGGFGGGFGGGYGGGGGGYGNQNPYDWWSSYLAGQNQGKKTTHAPEPTHSRSAPKTTSTHRPAQSTTSTRTTTSRTTDSTSSEPPRETSSSRSSTSTSRTTKATTTSSHPINDGGAAPTPDSATNSSVNSVGSSSPSNKTGLAVGLTLAALILLGLICAFVFFRRKRARNGQGSWKRLWNTSTFPGRSADRGNSMQENPLLYEKRNSLLGSPVSASMAKPLPPEPPYSTLSVISPPPNTFNNPSTLYQSPTVSSPQQRENISTITPAQRRSQDETARVRRGFIPSLPDELPISVGETIELVTVYDDGWCLCRNTQGERGMVPLECLDRSLSAQEDMASQDGRRYSQRASSLYDGIAPGTY